MVGWFQEKIGKIDGKKSFLITAIGCVLFLFLMMAQLRVKQSFVICVLFMTILFWTTDAAPKWMASLFLLLAFAFAQAAPFSQLFKFPLSQNFFLIALSYLFAEGIKKSRLFHGALPYLRRYVCGIKSFAVSMLLGCIIAIWVIPQPYTRVVILLQLYRIYFDSINLTEQCKKILCLWIVNTSMFVNAAIFKGDIILNGVLLEVSGFAINKGEWSRWMLFPTLLFTIIGMVLFYLAFRRELEEFQVKPGTWENTPEKADRVVIFIVFVTVIFWFLEPVLHLSALAVLILAVAAMVGKGIITVRDAKSVNVGLLVFLTAAFSIGPVMNYCGVAEELLSSLTHLIPDRISFLYLWILLCICIILHMVLGSCVTVLSVVVPSVLILIGNGAFVRPILFLVFVGCVTHYILCVHNVLLVVGTGIGGYSDAETRRYSKWLTPCVLLLAIPVYLTYWKAFHLY